MGFLGTSDASRRTLLGATLLIFATTTTNAEDVKTPAQSSEANQSAATEQSGPPEKQISEAASPDARAPHEKPPPKKRAARSREPKLSEKTDADLSARKPPPPSESLNPQRAKFTRVKTEGTGAGQAQDESDKVVTPPAPPASSSSPAVATAGSASESDAKLRERVQATLLNDRKLPYTARLVGVSVKQGTITLSGEVNTDYERTRVNQVVDRVRGKHDVVNRISVRNRSPESVQATAR
jgi:hypothetical protein